MGIPALEDCKPGISPKGFNVLVVEEAVPERVRGIIMPDSQKDKDKLVNVRGRIVDISPVAFDFAAFQGSAPRIGEVVMFAKLAGIMVKGADGLDYRIIDDKSINAVLDEDAFAGETA